MIPYNLFLITICYIYSMLNAISTSISGLLAAGKKAEIAAANITNADTVGAISPENGPEAYKPQKSLTVSIGEGAVQTVSLDRTPLFTPIYDPNSPFANEEGLINAPNVNLDEELINLKQAQNSYQSNAKVLQIGREMQETLTDALDHTA